jgi:hypothetical protein
MKRRLPVLILLLWIGSSISFGQSAPATDPLARYIAGVRTHKADPVALRFAADCGLNLTGIESRYAFANDETGTFHAVKDLAAAYDNVQMDLVGTEEVWKAGTRILVEEWNAELDVGGYARRLYCFDEKQKLQMVDDANFQLPTDDGMPWGMHERWTRRTVGMFAATVPFEFIGLDEKRIPAPKLDKEDQEFARAWGKVAPNAFPVSDLKLPPELLK